MDSLVVELRKEALDQSIPVTALLRKALVVAKKLRVEEFENWIELELDGYPDDGPIPDYRWVSGQVVVGSSYYMVSPVPFTDPKAAQHATRMCVAQPLRQLEEIAETKDQGSLLRISFSIEMEAWLARTQGIRLKPLLIVHQAQVTNIVEVVRNTILRWSLNLEEAGIHGQGASFSNDERQIAVTTNYQITNYIGSISNSQFQQASAGSLQIVEMKTPPPEEIVRFLDSLRSSLGELDLAPEIRSEVEADANSAQAQCSSAKPKTSVIRECLHSIRGVLESAAGSALATSLLGQLSKLLS